MNLIVWTRPSANCAFESQPRLGQVAMMSATHCSGSFTAPLGNNFFRRAGEFRHALSKFQHGELILLICAGSSAAVFVSSTRHAGVRPRR